MTIRAPVPLPRLRVAARTDIGSSRWYNEDGFVVASLCGPVTAGMLSSRPHPADWLALKRRCALDPPAPIVASFGRAAGVALAAIDGMGGSCMGDIAARIVEEAIVAALVAAPHGEEDADRRSVAAALAAASRAIVEVVATGSADYHGLSAAALLALVSGDRLHVAGVGDCRLYVLRCGSLTQLSRDDNLLNEWLAAGRAIEEYPNALPLHILTRALGFTNALAVTPSTIDLRAGDVLLLCSDGLHVFADDATIARVLLEQRDPFEACLALRDLVSYRGREDDVTVIVARPEGDDLRPPGPGDALKSRNVP